MTELLSFAAAIALMLLGAGVGFIGQRYWHRRKRADAAIVAVAEATADKIATLESKMAELQLQNALLKKDVMPISAAMQKLLIARLTNDHTLRTDALLEKVGPPNTLTAAEKHELAEALLDRAHEPDDRVDAAERLAAEALPVIMRIVQDEIDNAQPEPELEIVSVPQEKQPQEEKP